MILQSTSCASVETTATYRLYRAKFAYLISDLEIVWNVTVDFFLSRIFSFMHERVLHNASLYYILIDIEQNYMYLDSLETLLKTLVKDNVFLIHLSFDHLPFALSHSFSHKLSPLDLLRVGYYILQQWRAIAGWLSCSKQLSNDINWRHFPLSDAVNLTDWPIYSVVNAWHL